MAMTQFEERAHTLFMPHRHESIDHEIAICQETSICTPRLHKGRQAGAWFVSLKRSFEAWQQRRLVIEGHPWTETIQVNERVTVLL